MQQILVLLKIQTHDSQLRGCSGVAAQQWRPGARGRGAENQGRARAPLQRARPGRRAPGRGPHPPRVTAQAFRAFGTVPVSASSALLCGADVSLLVCDLLCSGALLLTQPWGGRKSLPVRRDILSSLGPPQPRTCRQSLPGRPTGHQPCPTRARRPSGPAPGMPCADLRGQPSSAPGQSGAKKQHPVTLTPCLCFFLLRTGGGEVCRHPSGGDEGACNTLSPCLARTKARYTSHVTE